MKPISIEELDKNFKLKSRVDKEDAVFYNALSSPFSLHGLIYENGEYVRMPDETAESVSPAVHRLSKNTAGGRLRFITDSPYVIIRAREPKFSFMPHMPLTGQCGFDLYRGKGKDSRYVGSFIPPISMETDYESILNVPGEGDKLLTLEFPLYNGVHELYIGLKEGSSLLPPDDYKIKSPVLYYGSSITQGGCASRPGTCYQALLSRDYDMDYINLGFSGNAKGEDNMADYIASLPISVFVYDYDHNAPTLTHYENTHYRFFLRFREKQPNTPVVFVTRPKFYLTESEKERVKIARRTYEGALDGGDKNVYFIEGETLMAPAGDGGTVDGTHPTDLGFFTMALGMKPTFDKIFGASRD